MTCEPPSTSTGPSPPSSDTSRSGTAGRWRSPTSLIKGSRSARSSCSRITTMNLARWIGSTTPPEELAQLALDIAEQTDARVATLPPEHLWPTDPESPLNPLRASHRGEHL